MTTAENPYGMIPGKRYKVEFEDCCIRGQITATFLHWDMTDVTELEFGIAVFDVGFLNGELRKVEAID